MVISFEMKTAYYKNRKSVKWVADWIEKNYGIVELFSKMYQSEIAQEVQEVLLFYALRNKRSPRVMVLERSTKLFQRALTNRKFDHKVAGVPTKRSLTRKGRFKSKPRPSFVDTGLYRRSLQIVLRK